MYRMQSQMWLQVIEMTIREKIEELIAYNQLKRSPPTGRVPDIIDIIREMAKLIQEGLDGKVDKNG